MTLQWNMRRIADEVWWRVRGVFATEELRSVGFQARSLWQASEIRARKEAAKQLAADVSSELAVTDASGYRVFSPSALPDVAVICERGREIAAELLARRASATGKKDFHRNQLATDTDKRRLLDLALDRRVLSMVTNYLGTIPVLGDVDYFMSVPSKPPWKKSQLWHCDDDSPRQLKLFVYCDDVEDDAGPFELIAAADSHAARRALKYRYAGKNYRITDEKMNSVISRDRQLALRGARGTAFAVDTVRCFHKGSRVTGEDRHRMVAVILYCAPNGMHMPLRLANQRGPYSHLDDTITDKIQRAVLGDPLV